MIETIIIVTAILLIVLAGIIWAIKQKLANGDNEPAATPSVKITGDKSNAPIERASDTTPVAAETVAPTIAVEPEPAPVVNSPATAIERAASVASVSDQPVASTKPVQMSTQEPEDSVLRRHYLAAREAEKLALSNPYPTDSVLRRHYEAMQRIDTPAASPVAEEVIAVSESIPVATVPVAESTPCKLALPEDSVLRRHFLAMLQQEIAADLPVQPTDSTLKRHYAALLQAQLDSRLAADFGI